jgi:hypothetical protein
LIRTAPFGSYPSQIGEERASQLKIRTYNAVRSEIKGRCTFDKKLFTRPIFKLRVIISSVVLIIKQEFYLYRRIHFFKRLIAGLHQKLILGGPFYCN